MSNDSLRVVLRNNLAEIGKLRQELDNFGQALGLSSKTQSELNLILEEVVTNVISYAYRDARQHKILVKAELRDAELVIEVEDDGDPFNPLQVPSPDLESPLEQRKVGGLGLHLVREFTNSMEYFREEEKNRLIVRKKMEGRQAT